MSTVLVIDLETTGLDYTRDRITEVSGVLLDPVNKRIVRSMSEVVNDLLDENGLPRELPDGVGTEIHGMTESFILEYGIPLYDALYKLAAMGSRADYLCAHNKSFEMNFLGKQNPQVAEDIQTLVRERDWIDTMTDLPYSPANGWGVGNLSQICSDHNCRLVFPHCAFSDAEGTAKLLTMYPFDEVLEIAKSPTHKVIAMVKGSGHKKGYARKLGYYWDGSDYSKQVKGMNLDMEQKKAGRFGVHLDIRPPEPEQMSLLLYNE